MSRYAEDTKVSTEASRAEIERTLRRYKATAFAYGWDRDNAMVQFEAQGKRIRFVLPMPDRYAKEFTRTPERGLERTAAQAEAAWEQACRQRWRALSLAIKAKLEAVEAEISSFEDEFMAHIVLPSGETVGEWMGPQIDRAYELGSMPAMLPALGPGVG